MSTGTVILSGGLDSTVALAWAADRHPEGDLTALTFAYGQRHVREIDSAVAVAAYYGAAHRVLDLEGIMSNSALLADSGEPIPLDSYDEESMESTVVHGRNLLFASLAVASVDPEARVYLGVHGGDHHLYPDCRPEFWHSLTPLVRQAYGTRLVTPFLNMDKAQIVLEGHRLGAPMDLTWSCYAGGGRHCGACGTCVERRGAFVSAGVDDPTEYEGVEHDQG